MRKSQAITGTNLQSKLRRSVLSFLMILVAGRGAFSQDLKSVSFSLAGRIGTSGRKTVAVVDFTDLQGNVTELGRFLAEELSVDLLGDAKGFEVIDRTHLNALLQEHKLSTRGLIDPQTARKLGQIAGLDVIVTGTITPSRGQHQALCEGVGHCYGEDDRGIHSRHPKDQGDRGLIRQGD